MQETTDACEIIRARFKIQREANVDQPEFPARAAFPEYRRPLKSRLLSFLLGSIAGFAAVVMVAGIAAIVALLLMSVLP